MAVIFGKITNFGNINLNTTIHENVGDKVTGSINRPKFSSATYARRHVVISGLLKGVFPETDYPDDIGVVGSVWPYDDFKGVKTFDIVALEPNSSYHCFIPSSGYHINHEVVDLIENQSVNLEIGSMYVPLVEFNFKNSINALGSVVSCINQSTTITPLATGKIVKLTAVKSDTTTSTLYQLS